MMTLVIAAAAAAAQPVATSPSTATQAPNAEHQHGKSAEHKDMDCCKDCCKDMARKPEGHTGQ